MFTTMSPHLQVFSVVARDSFGNVVTSSNLEFLLRIVKDNATVPAAVERGGNE